MSNVSASLHEWAVKEMNYTGPWSEDMAVLCTGPMAKVWKWVVEHCRSREKVKMIQGNLALARRKVGGCDMSMNVSRVGNNSGEGGEREELLAEKGKLLGDLHAVLAKIERLKGAIELHNKDRLDLSKCKEERTKEVKERQQRTVLLGLHVKQVMNTITKMDELAKKLEKLVEKVVEKEVKGETMFSSGGGVETESSKNAREAVETGVEHLKAVFSGENVKDGRGEARGQILNLVGEMPAALVSNCLVEQAKDSTRQVRKRIENVDLEGDAKQLQKDDDEHGVYLDSVRQGVGEFYKKHVTSQMAVTNLATSISSWEEKADLAKEKVGGGIADVDMAELDKARQRGVVTSLRSSLESLKSHLAGLEGSKNNLPETVRNQEQQIEDLGQIISALLISDTTPVLKNCQASTLNTMAGAIPLLASQVTSLSQARADAPSNHLSILSTCPTSNLSSTVVGSQTCSVLTPVSQLTINRRSSALPQLNERLSKKEDLVEIISKVILEVERRERELAHSSTGKVMNEDMAELDSLEKTLTNSIREQGRNLGPLIEEGDRHRQEMVKLSANIELLHNDWSSQPGAEVAVGGSVVWGELEGRNMQKWVDLVRINLAKLYSNNNG